MRRKHLRGKRKWQEAVLHFDIERSNSNVGHLVHTEREPYCLDGLCLFERGRYDENRWYRNLKQSVQTVVPETRLPDLAPPVTKNRPEKLPQCGFQATPENRKSRGAVESTKVLKDVFSL